MSGDKLLHTDCDCCERAQTIIDALRASIAMKDKALEPLLNQMKFYKAKRDEYRCHPELTAKQLRDIEAAAQSSHTTGGENGR